MSYETTKPDTPVLLGCVYSRSAPYGVRGLSQYEAADVPAKIYASSALAQCRQKKTLYVLEQQVWDAIAQAV